MALRTADFDFVLPAELIAARPPAGRADARMMVLDRRRGTIEHGWFRELPERIETGDLVVLNDTRVVPARVISDDGAVELLCLEQASACEWRCLVRPGRRMKRGRTVRVGGCTGTVTAVLEDGDRWIRWDQPPDLDTHGKLALPHYLGRDEEPSDRDRYQTVFAREAGAIAAPTAGLHFTPEILARIPHEFLTLHVGVGTFRPVSVDDPSAHVMHAEQFAVSAECAARVNAAGRVVAVGTTVTRVLESLAREHAGAGSGRIAACDHRGETNLFIRPPFEFRATGALLTNFHLPKSTLLMLVCAFAGREFMLEAYRQAVAARYRFFSYGDCMWIR